MADIGPYKKITKKDFAKLYLLAGKITDVKKHPTLKTYYILTIDCLAQDEEYQSVTDLANAYTMSQLIGKQITIVGNLPSEKIGGIESNAMILVAYKNKKPVLICPEKNVPEGAQIHGLLNGDTTYK
jgi:methionyl-tRNA synthetase